MLYEGGILITSMSGNQFQTPILLLVFNRLDTTKLVFEQIKRVKPSRLYIAGDGARASKPNEAIVVEQTRSWIIENITWECECKTLFRTENLGCGKAVSSGISWFFENEGMGIILEDDCLPDITFFKYCEELLIKYKDDSRIASICASNTLGNTIDIKDSYFFSKYSLIWGWATWRRAWNDYDLKMEKWPQLKKSGWLSNINRSFLFNVYWTYIFDACYYGRVDTWDYQWINACWRQGGLSIIPATNMVRNIGIGNNSTHEIDERFSNFKEQHITFPLKHPTDIKILEKADELLTQRIFTVSKVTYIGIFLMRFKVFQLANDFRKILRKAISTKSNG